VTGRAEPPRLLLRSSEQWWNQGRREARTAAGAVSRGLRKDMSRASLLGLLPIFFRHATVSFVNLHKNASDYLL